jgi:ATP-dependent RNA helicase RhlE
MPFPALGLPASVVRGVRSAGYTTPTPVQSEAIPVILTGADLVAAAQTGSGKTAAFLLPMIARLLTGHRAVRGLVLVPTRELAAQVEENAKIYSKYTNVRAGAVYGGVPIPPQERMLGREGVEILIATPGRLLDLHGRQSVSLEEVEVLVLDEADRMVDMGFAPDLQRILRLLPRERQTLMFSATMPPELNKVAKEALHDPVRLSLSPPTRPAAAIEQAFYPVPSHLKVELLHHILENEEDPCSIVFARTKRGAERLARRLKTLGHSVAAMHGDRSQSQRERAMRDFKRGRISVLVATDIASRGIDVTGITHVVNFDVPRSPEDYVHRIGRTGRMDATGDAITLVSPAEDKDAAVIERSIGRRVDRVIVPDFDYKQRAEKTAREAPEHRRERGADRPQRAPSRVVRSYDSHAPARPAAPRAHLSGSTPSAGSGASAAVADTGAEHGRPRKRNTADRRNRKRM